MVMNYHKQAIPVKDQIQLLKSRGLLAGDESLAEHYLNNISYYRLAGYWWPMQADKVNHLFKPNSRFEDVVALYSFDCELRLLLAISPGQGGRGNWRLTSHQTIVSFFCLTMILSPEKRVDLDREG